MIEAEDRALLDRLIALPVDEVAQVLERLTHPQLRELNRRWTMWAHDGQLAPTGDGWRVWLMCAGRGFGKTRAGAEWVTDMARAHPDARIALIGASLSEARRVMVEGPSGVIAAAREGERVKWQPTAGLVRFANGAEAQVYSAGAPESLRGPEHHFAWCDELAKWRGDTAWNNLLLGLRLGERPRALVTTTPRSTALMRQVMQAADTIVTRGRTDDNLHLPGSFVSAMRAAHDGTRWGRQELDGELLDDVAGALWPRWLLERQRVERAPDLVRVVVAVDPAASAGGDTCGIVAAGVNAAGHGYVLEDASVSGASPDGWARAVAACAARRGADRIVAEKNNGGDMVERVLRTADASLPITLVHASHGKTKRAEPVAALYEQGKVWHVGAMTALEDELAGLSTSGDYDGPGRSPDRADACVWALWALMLDKGGTPKVRALR